MDPARHPVYCRQGAFSSQCGGLGPKRGSPCLRHYWGRVQPGYSQDLYRHEESYSYHLDEPRALDKTKLTGNEAGASTASEGDNVPWNGPRALWGALSQVQEQLEQLVKNSTRNTQTG